VGDAGRLMQPAHRLSAGTHQDGAERTADEDDAVSPLHQLAGGW
jgi:hypothetical protein